MSNLHPLVDLANTDQLKDFHLINAQVALIDTNIVKLRLSDNRECTVPIEEFFNDRGLLGIRSNEVVTLVKDRITPDHYSYRKAQQILGGLKLKNAWENGKTVTGVVDCLVDGGFRVLVKGVGAYLPVKGAAHDLTDKAPSDIVGRTGKFRVTHFSATGTVTLALVDFTQTISHKNIDALTAVYAQGDIAEGLVTQIMQYGAFVDINGVGCLLHISDLSWEKVDEVEAYVTKGDRLRVKILKIDPVTRRVNVGLKQLTTLMNPWKGLADKYPKGTKITRKIIGLADYGFFVEIEPRIQGLVHLSEISWGKRYTDELHRFRVGDMVEVMVINVDTEREKIALSYKRCLPNPWFLFAGAHRVREILTVTIRAIGAKGIFVDLGNGIDGRISLTDLPSSLSREDIYQDYGVGARIDAILIFIDPINERIRLSMLPNGEKHD